MCLSAKMLFKLLCKQCQENKTIILEENAYGKIHLIKDYYLKYTNNSKLNSKSQLTNQKRRHTCNNNNKKLMRSCSTAYVKSQNTTINPQQRPKGRTLVKPNAVRLWNSLAASYKAAHSYHTTQQQSSLVRSGVCFVLERVLCKPH